jgi:heat shock protein HslJ
MSKIARVLPLLAVFWIGPSFTAAAGEAASPPTPARRTADPSIIRTLQDHRWTLQSANDSAGRPIDALLPPGHPFVMAFDGARVGIRGGCNQSSGGWRLSPLGQLTVSRLAGTMKACDAALMQADTALSAVLAQPMTVELTRGAAPSLRLSTPMQQVLAFSGEPTLRSLHGVPKRLFLEVAAETVACRLPSGAAGSCLQVREVRYDDKGLRKGPPGPWRPFVEHIEGFTHTPGVRNVLRIDRYERKPALADGSATVYVLDLVVESETVVRK